jgi:lipopolysaccharide export system protein LptA
MSSAWPLIVRIYFALTLLTSVGVSALDSDKNQPIQIVADMAVRDESSGDTRYEGNVILTQGSLRITADRIAVQHDEGDADRIVAVGQPATLVQQPAPDQQPVDASADRIVYLRSRDLVRLRGAARISQDGSILSGEQIDYLVTQRKVKAAGSADSAGEGRVEVVIPPENLRRSSADD